MATVLESSTNVPPHVPAHLVFDFDIYKDPRVTEDVQGSYAAALDNAPDIFYSPANGGHWMVRRYDAITEIVKDPAHFSVREMQIPRVANPPFFIPLSLDPPVNIPYRQALMPSFSPKAVAELEPKIRRWAVEIIEEVAQRGECDFVQDVSARFPVSVFMELMGMPIERLREFRSLADEYFKARTNEDIAKLGGRIVGLMTELIELRRREPGKDLVSRLIAMQIDGRPIKLEEMQAMCLILFLGGMDTVTNVTGFTYQTFGADPALQARLAADPALVPKFVDEALRCFGVVNTPRIVISDSDLFGVPFRTGDMVLCLLPMAGRDGKLHNNPNDFDIDRAKTTHLTFSVGPHLCLGHILARSEMRILTEEWIKRIPSFSVKSGSRHGFRIGTVQAIESLPLEWPVKRD
jgi:cytochrome P450